MWGVGFTACVIPFLLQGNDSKPLSLVRWGSVCYKLLTLWLVGQKICWSLAYYKLLPLWLVAAATLVDDCCHSGWWNRLDFFVFHLHATSCVAQSDLPNWIHAANYLSDPLNLAIFCGDAMQCQCYSSFDYLLALVVFISRRTCILLSILIGLPYYVSCLLYKYLGQIGCLFILTLVITMNDCNV